MKKFILSLFLLSISAALSGQIVPEWYEGDLSKKGTRIAVDSVKLDKEATYALLDQLGGAELVESWQKDARLRNWGLGMTIGGYTLGAAGLCIGGVYFLAGLVGTIFVAIGGQEAVDNLWEDIGSKAAIGGAIMLTGLAVGTTGAVLLGKGNRGMRKTVEYCNSLGQQREAEIAFGPTRHGIGFTYKF